MHLCDNKHQLAGDRLFKIGQFWGICTKDFQRLVVLSKVVSIDESFILQKGRFHFKQYIPNKASKFGIKTFSLVDEKTKFLVNSMIYSGKNQDLTFSTKEFGYGGSIVMQLMQPYIELRHHVYCDNWFTSSNLALELLQKSTYLCGTIRKDRKNLDAPKKNEKG